MLQAVLHSVLTLTQLHSVLTSFSYCTLSSLTIFTLYTQFSPHSHTVHPVLTPFSLTHLSFIRHHLLHPLIDPDAACSWPHIAEAHSVVVLDRVQHGNDVTRLTAHIIIWVFKAHHIGIGHEHGEAASQGLQDHLSPTACLLIECGRPKVTGLISVLHVVVCVAVDVVRVQLCAGIRVDRQDEVVTDTLGWCKSKGVS